MLFQVTFRLHLLSQPMVVTACPILKPSTDSEQMDTKKSFHTLFGVEELHIGLGVHKHILCQYRRTIGLVYDREVLLPVLVTIRGILSQLDTLHLTLLTQEFGESVRIGLSLCSPGRPSCRVVPFSVITRGVTMYRDEDTVTRPILFTYLVRTGRTRRQSDVGQFRHDVKYCISTYFKFLLESFDEHSRPTILPK